MHWLFSETNSLALKLLGIVVATVGTFMIIERKRGAENDAERRVWLLYALLAAIFAALTSVLAKIGIQGVESNLATSIRTTVVLVMAWAIVVGKGKLPLVRRTDRRELGFLAASGVATGAQMGWASSGGVAPLGPRRLSPRRPDPRRPAHALEC